MGPVICMIDQIIDEHDAMAEAAFLHFSDVLGKADARDFSLELTQLRNAPFDLADLEAPFSEDEIWRAVKNLPAGKALGPMGSRRNFFVLAGISSNTTSPRLSHRMGEAFRSLTKLSSPCYPNLRMPKHFLTTAPSASSTL